MFRLAVHHGVIAATVLLSLVVGVGKAADEEVSARELIGEAAQAMEAGEFDRAIDCYGRMREALPEEAAVPYNLGVAHYRKGEFGRAAELFEEALTLARDADLRNRSTYNLGNSAYAQSLETLQDQSDPQQSMENIDTAAGRLEEAIKHYKRALAGDPEDEDARANAELSHRLLKELRELQEQMKQQQQQQGDQEQDEQSSGDQDQQQDQQPPEQQQGEQQQQDEPQRDQQDQDQQQSPEQQQQESESPEEQESEAQQQQSQEGEEQQEEQESQRQEQQQAAQTEEQKQEKEGQQADTEQNEMSKEEARRLLQRVRDKERARREELAKQRQARHKPAEKDW